MKLLTRRTTLFGGLAATALAARSVRSSLPSKREPGEVQHPLPSLPLANGAKVAGLGHSLLANGTYSRWSPVLQAMQGCSRTARGVLYHIEALDGRFNLDAFADAHIPDIRIPAGNAAVTGSQQGIGGDHLYAAGKAPGTINRTPYVLARGPQIVLLDIGTNDVSSGVGGPFGVDNSAKAIIAALDHQIELLTRAGVWTVVCTIPWRFDLHPGDPKLATIDTVNAWIVAQARRSGTKVHDRRALNGTATAPHGAGVDAIIGLDGVHPTSVGAREDAKLLLPLLRSMVVAGDRRNLDAGARNMFPWKGLHGAAGKMGAGITGNLATGLVATRMTGTSNYVVAKESAGAGNEKQVITVKPTKDKAPLHLLKIATMSDLDLAALAIKAGDWLEVLLPVELDRWDGWNFNGGSKSGPVALYNEQYQAGTFLWETNVSTGTPGASMILSARVPIQPGATVLRWSSRPIQIAHRGDVEGTGTIKLGSPIIRKIANPRAAWML